jgi:hypothetical protein
MVFFLRSGRISRELAARGFETGRDFLRTIRAALVRDGNR